MASISKQPALFTDPILSDGFGCTIKNQTKSVLPGRLPFLL